MNYKEAGVDIELAESFITNLSPNIELTHENVIKSKNNFCGLYDLSELNMTKPVLACTTDGVGSKIKLANHFKHYRTIGKDVVFNNVNDIICSGAKPLCFLDYFAIGKLDVNVGNDILGGIIDACLATNVSLIGGETAELPLTYTDGDLDLVGTCIGVVEKTNIFDPDDLSLGDVLIGLKSSGPHSNGYSIINRIVWENPMPMENIEQFLKPTINYYDHICILRDYVDILGAANITGGGIKQNLSRILPDRLTAVIDLGSFTVPDVFMHIQSLGKLTEDEMWNVFNMGIGMILVVDPNDADFVLNKLGDDAVQLGFLIKRTNDQSVIFN